MVITSLNNIDQVIVVKKCSLFVLGSESNRNNIHASCCSANHS